MGVSSRTQKLPRAASRLICRVLTSRFNGRGALAPFTDGGTGEKRRAATRSPWEDEDRLRQKAEDGDSGRRSYVRTPSLHKHHLLVLVFMDQSSRRETFWPEGKSVAGRFPLLRRPGFRSHSRGRLDVNKDFFLPERGGPAAADNGPLLHALDKPTSGGPRQGDDGELFAEMSTR